MYKPMDMYSLIKDGLAIYHEIIQAVSVDISNMSPTYLKELKGYLTKFRILYEENGNELVCRLDEAERDLLDRYKKHPRRLDLFN